MGYRRLRIPVWLAAAALFATFVIGASAGPAVLPDVVSAFRIVTPAVSDVITQDLTPEIAADLNLGRAQGVLVTDVIGAPLQRGDVILAINGTPVACQKEFDAQLAKVNFGQTFFAEICRDGQAQTVTLQRGIETPPLLALSDLPTVEIRGIRAASLPTEDGVIIAEVQIATPASDVGLKTGDIILDVNGHHVRSANEFLGFMRQLSERESIFTVLQTNGQINVVIIPS